MAEGLLRHRVGDRGVAVSSAGMLRDGDAASTHGISALSRRGIDLVAHQSRRMTADLLRQADLVLGMAREHVREAAVLAPEAWGRTFTLKELVRRGEQAGPRALDQPLDEWLAKVGADRRRSELMGGGAADDIADPYGMAASDYERTACELEDLVDRLVALVWP